MTHLKILELFCGTKSFTKVSEDKGHKAYTIDIDEKFNPDLCKDVLDVELSDIPFQPDIIWASPPCTEYSIAKTVGVRNLEYADSIVKKTLQLIQELKPKTWIMENPQTGLLKSRPFMYRIPYCNASYCKYGYPYRKNTTFWNNMGLKLEICRNDCDQRVDGRHKAVIGNRFHRRTVLGKVVPLMDRYAIPEKLCVSILEQCERFIEEGRDPITTPDQVKLF